MTSSRIDKDELYPFYFLNDRYGTEVELTEAEVAWVASAMEEFDKTQVFLAEKFRGGLNNDQ